MHGLKIGWMAFPIAYYAANAVWQGYMSLYYRGIGFGEGKIGLISAAMALAALLLQPVWGKLGDRSKKTNRLLALLALLSGAVLLPVLAHDGFFWQMAFACLFYVFYCALLPMGDSILLEVLNRNDMPFGPYRLAGAVSFAAAGAAFGGVLDRWGRKSVVLVSAGLLVLTAFAAWMLPESKRKPKRKPAFRALFRDRDLMIMLAFMIPVQMTMGYFYTFFSTYFSALPGANPQLLGVGYAIATAGEIPYLLFCDRIFDRFGAARPMCVSAFVLMLRWILLGFSKNAYPALASQILHGGGFIVMTVSMAKYIAAHTDENLRASGQMLLSMASYGIARVAGNLGGGFLAERYGGANVFLLAAGVCFAALCAFAPKAFRSGS